MPIALMTYDPQPSVVLDADGLALTVNRALTVLLAGKPLNHVSSLLPNNLRELIRACLQQGRAIEQV